jgi:methionyl-tRNA formyltransferase
LRLAFLGTSAFACPALAALSDFHEIVLVVTQPDRPAGRKHVLRPSPVKVEAQRRGLPIAQPERINAPRAVRSLQASRPGAIVVAAYGQLLRPTVFQLPPLGTINIHASLLPRYRGAAPVNWAILRGDEQTGVTTFLIDAGMDTGPILLQQAIPIGPDETAGALHDRLAELGATVILETLARLEDGTVTPNPQDERRATFAPKLTRADGVIDWQQPAARIHDHVRGSNPWPGAFTHLCGEPVKIHRTARTGIARGTTQPGGITVPETGRLLVGTTDELIEVLEVQRVCRERTTGRAFLNGLRGETTFS